VLFFVKRYPADLLKFTATFMKLMYDQDIFNEEFLIKWFNREIKSDKGCALYDRKAEKVFKAQIETFIEWLK
jgi:eIF4-gamma/eIF5/eIF2-epsilon